VVNSYNAVEREAVYRTIRERRDVRRFTDGIVPDDVLYRILRAASYAPSVGYMQPWNFILVRGREIRKEMHRLFLEANREGLKFFEGERAEQYKNLKLEGILDSALNICVTCDRTRAGPVVLGRTCQPEMDLFSTVCAVQNLWLAARAEGIAVGWVSILKPADIVRVLKLPGNITPVAYLCVGQTETFAPEPELKTFGWLPEIPFEELIFENEWGKLAPK
jgi:5,6-dimethylbenzimidazole synthase